MDSRHLYLQQLFEKKATLFISENMLMRELYLCDKVKNNVTNKHEKSQWEEKQKTALKNLELVEKDPSSPILKKIKETALEEAEISEKQALANLEIAFQFYYDAEMNDELYNNPEYKNLKEKTQLEDHEKIKLEEIEQKLINSAMSNAKGVDITKPVSIVDWNLPCAQYNPIDRPGRYFFPLEKGITHPKALGTLSINVWTVMSAIRNQGEPVRPLTPYQPLKPIKALRSTASATVDHWSLSHPGDKRPVITFGGADQLFIPVPRRKDLKETKSVFDTMMKALPKIVLDEELYKNIDKENPQTDIEKRSKESASQRISGWVANQKAHKRQKKSIANFPQFELASQLRDAVSTQIDIIDVALCISAEQEKVFQNELINSNPGKYTNNQGEKIHRGEELWDTFKSILSGKEGDKNQLSSDHQKDLQSLEKMQNFKKLMKKYKDNLYQLLNEKKPLEELKVQIEKQSNEVNHAIQQYQAEPITVSKPRSLWNRFLRKIGWIKEHPRKAIACVAATILTGGIAAKIAVAHFIALGTYKIAAGLVAGSGATTIGIKSINPIKKLLSSSRLKTNTLDAKDNIVPLPEKRILEEESKTISSDLNNGQKIHQVTMQKNHSNLH